MALSNDIERLVYFGDSLSDRGRFYDLSSQVLKVAVPPASEGYAGWFSNGEVQSGYTPQLLGLETESYAVGGANARGSRTIADYIASFGEPDILAAPLSSLPQVVLNTDTNLGGQVQSFLADLGPGGVAPGTAAAFFIGVNDYNSLDPGNLPNPAAFIGEVVGSIVAAATAVTAAGVDQVLFYNLPDPTFFPVELIYPPEMIALGRQLVEAHNAALAGAAAQLQGTGIDVEVVDIHRIAQEITMDPRTFGLLPQFLDTPVHLGSPSRPVWNTVTDSWSLPDNAAVASVDPDRLAFFDILHPTTATHGVLGAFAAESLRSETTLLGGNNDTLLAGSKRDLVLAGGGADKISAGAGDDVVLAGLGNDLVAGGNGRDILVGGAGCDALCGGRGDDLVAGSDGRDIQLGGRGDDVLIDGLGRDVLSGGKGGDAFIYVEATALGGSNATDGGLFFGGSGHDTLYLVLDEATRAVVEAELGSGSHQVLAAIGVVTHSIESHVFLDAAEGLDGISTGARLREADIWGLV